MHPPPSVETSLRLIQQSLEAQDEVLEKLDHAVNGNGKDGLVVRVDRLEQRARQAIEASKGRLKWWHLIVGALATAAAAPLLMALAQAIVHGGGK